MLRLLSALSMSVSATTPNCQALDEKALSIVVRDVRAEQDSLRQMDALARLGAFWSAACSREHFDASPDAVRSIASLLSIPRSRWVVTSMLFDVGPNLRSALADLRLARSDQIATDKKTRAKAYPFPVTNDGVLAASLSCLATKAAENKIDRQLCRFLQHAKKYGGE